MRDHARLRPRSLTPSRWRTTRRCTGNISAHPPESGPRRHNTSDVRRNTEGWKPARASTQFTCNSPSLRQILRLVDKVIMIKGKSKSPPKFPLPPLYPLRFSDERPGGVAGCDKSPDGGIALIRNGAGAKPLRQWPLCFASARLVLPLTRFTDGALHSSGRHV